MNISTSGPVRLYLMQVALIPGRNAPIPCYLVQTGDGKNILIDSGLPVDFHPPAGTPLSALSSQKNVLEQLASIGLQPADIDLLICTHYDIDHAGNHGVFSNARLIVQRQHYEVATGGHQRFTATRSQWDQPATRYDLLNGDTELLSGLELIDTDGHVPGHQSVLVRLPHTGPVILAIDAVTVQENFTPEREQAPMDMDKEKTIASTRKLLELAKREQASLVVFGHDGAQWATLKKLPEYYD